MWILYLFLLLFFISAVYAGYKPWFQLHRLTKANVLNATLIILSIFTLMMAAHFTGFFPQSVAAPFMMCIYVAIAGFFGGYSYRLYKLRKEVRHTLYQQRSFWIDHMPNLVSASLIAYGLFRMAVFTDQPITGIRFTSGSSLIFIGIFFWTLKVVPEFRSGGIILLDRKIPWDRVISWNWHSEEVLNIDFITPDKNTDHENRIMQFFTSIPADERKEIETVLNSKMDEFSEERQNVMFGDD